MANKVLAVFAAVVVMLSLNVGIASAQENRSSSPNIGFEQIYPTPNSPQDLRNDSCSYEADIVNNSDTDYWISFPIEDSRSYTPEDFLPNRQFVGNPNFIDPEVNGSRRLFLFEAGESVRARFYDVKDLNFITNNETINLSFILIKISDADNAFELEPEVAFDVADLQSLAPRCAIGSPVTTTTVPVTTTVPTTTTTAPTSGATTTTAPNSGEPTTTVPETTTTVPETTTTTETPIAVTSVVPQTNTPQFGRPNVPVPTTIDCADTAKLLSEFSSNAVTNDCEVTPEVASPGEPVRNDLSTTNVVQASSTPRFALTGANSLTAAMVAFAMLVMGCVVLAYRKSQM